jgi:hypothetical protein
VARSCFEQLCVVRDNVCDVDLLDAGEDAAQAVAEVVAEDAVEAHVGAFERLAAASLGVASGVNRRGRAGALEATITSHLRP